MALPSHTLSARHPAAMQALAGTLSLQRGRLHEFCGPSRVALAVLVMAKSDGPVLWIRLNWGSEPLNPAGMQPLANPARLILARADRDDDALWSAEEALRSGAVPLVVMELPTPPKLTPVRRLHLAAEAGAEAARNARATAPLGLLLLPAEGGAQGTESRWHMAPSPVHSLLTESRNVWLLTRLRARMAPLAQWRLIRNSQGEETLETQNLSL